MNGLMNGKPYHGLRRPQTRVSLFKPSLDYEEITKIVEQGIAKGLVIPSAVKCDILEVRKQLSMPTRGFGKRDCIICGNQYEKLSSGSTVCTPCKSAESACAICGSAFVAYRKGRKKTSTCSSKCAVELMKHTKKNSKK